MPAKKKAMLTKRRVVGAVSAYAAWQLYKVRATLTNDPSDRLHVPLVFIPFGFLYISLFFPIQITQFNTTLVLMQISKSPSGRNTKSKLGSGGPGGKDGIEEEVKVPGKGSRKKFDRKASFRNLLWGMVI